MTLEPIPFEASEFFETVDSQALLLTDALETGDCAYIAHAFGVIAKARGMTGIARDAGVTREALYKALSEKGDPKLSTLLGVAKALGLKFTVVPASDAAE